MARARGQGLVTLTFRRHRPGLTSLILATRVNKL